MENWTCEICQITIRAASKLRHLRTKTHTHNSQNRQIENITKEKNELNSFLCEPCGVRLFNCNRQRHEKSKTHNQKIDNQCTPVIVVSSKKPTTRNSGLIKKKKTDDKTQIKCNQKTIPFQRIGGKRRLFKEIEKVIPKHNTYIEPFVGGGAVFFLKEKAKNNIINDLETSLIDDYKNILKIGKNDDLSDLKRLDSHDEIKDWIENTKSTPVNDFIKSVYKRNSRFGGKSTGKFYGKRINPFYKIQQLPSAQYKLTDTTILSQSYQSVIEKYDKKDSFIFLDPPYEESKGLYENWSIDYKEMANILKNVKGKFLLTINDSHNIRKIFSSFKIREILVPAVNPNGRQGIGSTDRKELFITNY